MDSLEPTKILLRDLKSLKSMFSSLPLDLVDLAPAVLLMVVTKAEVEGCRPSEAVRLLLNELAAREEIESSLEEKE